MLKVNTTDISICQAAYDYSINYRMLPRYVHHIGDADVNENVGVPSIHTVYVKSRQQFSYGAKNGHANYFL